PSPGAGTYRVTLRSDAGVLACKEVAVAPHPRPRPARPGAVWAVERSWNRPTENLYSAWIEHLFDDPLDAQPSWHGLDAILRDPARNFLHDPLGAGEASAPSTAMHLEPDCADLPFFLRAYFAWKLGLPFGYSECSRGSASAPPRCGGWYS